MKKEKILLLIIVLLVILMICVIAGILLLQQSEEKSKLATEEVIIDKEIDNKLKIVTSRNNFYIAKRCVENFYTYYSELYKDPLDGYLIKPENIDTEEIKNTRKEKVYNILDEKYIEYKEITLENLESKFQKIGDISINIENMYYIENEKNISIYFVYGTKKDSLVSEVTNFSIMVKVDLKDRTYKLLLDDYVENFYKDLQLGQDLEILDEEINENKYNTFSYQHISDIDYVNDLFSHYKKSIRFSKEQSYNLLNEKYKEIVFGNLDEYLSYINLNYLKIASAQIDTYSVERNDEYTQYLFKDKKGNYYIFKETAPFHYSVMLDNYTIPTPDFIEEYKGSNDKEKVILNIKRFFIGIDDKNYGYSYSVLSNAFKNNKYPIKNDFTNYAKQNFFEQNEIEYVSYEKENGLYICKIKLTDATGKSSEEKIFNIIIKLNSGTDFEMSFGEE